MNAAPLPACYQPAAPATAYQLFLVGLGHELYRHNVDGSFHLRAGAGRIEYTRTGIGHIPYADEDAAEEFARAFERANPDVLGPALPTAQELWWS